MLIAGDIGGTKTLLGLYSPEQGPRRPVKQTLFHSADYASLDEIVRAFMAEMGTKAEAAVFDVAGPVVAGRAHLTNLPWEIEEEALRSSLGLERAALLNDLKAVAYAVPHLVAEDLHSLNAGRPEPRGTIAVIAPGTGLGEAFLVWDGTRYVACASEGGHADFAPADELQIGLWRHVAHRYGHVAYERVCSGMGLPNIYDFLRDTGFSPEAPGFADRLAAEHDRTPLIVQAALEGAAQNALAAKTLETFVAILAAEGGNLALKFLATGGVYLAGGLPPRVLPLLDAATFMQAFASKGRFTDLLHTVPVHVVMCNAALLGAAAYGADMLGWRSAA